VLRDRQWRVSGAKGYSQAEVAAKETAA